MANNVHDIIKAERKKRGIPPMYWSRGMARLAQSQANQCARVGRLVHSDRYAFQGGENLAQGGERFSPKAIVSCWMHSKAGHREYLLSPRVTKAGVGIAKRNGKTFAAWAFSSHSPSFPDCPRYKSKSVFKVPGGTQFRLPKFRLLGGRGMLRAPVSLVVGLLGLWGVLLGAHGLYCYFTRLELLFGGGIDKLFMTFDAPGRLGVSVVWMSVKALQSWFIPAVVFIGGWVVMSWSGLWDNVSKLLSKFRLW